jgi:tRNA(fMet)-specific endonuclease VapC
MEEVDEAVADAYVQIKVMLQASGQIIPEADIWIAATALVGNYTLVTRDAHFSRILGIHVEDWSRP